MATMPRSEGVSPLGSENADGIAVHEQAEDMPSLPVGKFARLDDSTLACAGGEPFRIHRSTDGGATWDGHPPQADGAPVECAPTGAFLQTRNGTLVLAFADPARRQWTWDDALRDAPGAVLPTCAMRSTDGGATWRNLQTLHEEWTGATRDILQTRGGRVVFASMQMRHRPGRHTVLCYGSEDDGATWERSNIIDLGGNGHHDGATEGTILELTDGRLLQLIRTNWGQLWRALSEDEGRTWHPYGPSGIPASSTPAMLTRLASGRVALLWNRPYPEGADTYPLRGGGGVFSATPVSNFREELSLSFSEDDCQTWSPPVVIARHRGSEVSYPYAFEPEPGVLWITAHRWELRMALREGNFVP